MLVIVDRLRAAGCVFAEDEARLLVQEARNADDLESMVAKRVAGLPLEHVLGWAEFLGLRITVGPGVFVPRRRTEFLVAQAALHCRPGAIALDLCCGSGAVGAALRSITDGIDLYAADIDPVAVACARHNLAATAHQVFAGDLFEPLPTRLRHAVDVLVVNAPYVPTQAIALMPPEAREHEPTWALDGGGDGLVIARRVSTQAPQWLARGGTLLIETSARQSERLAEAMELAGLQAAVEHDDELGATIVAGCVSLR